MDDVQPLRPKPGRLTLIFLVVVAVAVAIGSALSTKATQTSTSIGGPMQGERAPEIVMTDFDGNTWRLSEFLERDGRPLFVNLWASWCEPCREEIPELSAFAAAHPEYAIVGVAVRDTEDEARALAEELDPAYLVGIETERDVRSDYVGFGLPATFLIDRTGTVTVQIEGPVTSEFLEDLTTG